MSLRGFLCFGKEKMEFESDSSYPFIMFRAPARNNFKKKKVGTAFRAMSDVRFNFTISQSI